jgi:AcrR family transcriptional regulator
MQRTSKERILESAIEVFAEKGKRGTHIEEIAAKANINKAMVYYYYTSKDYLYEEVISLVVKNLYQSLHHAFEKAVQSETDPVKDINHFLAAHFEEQKKPYARILLDALANESEQLRVSFVSTLINRESNFPQEVLKSFKTGVAKGIFRNINYKHVLISIIGMNLIYFLSKPIMQSLLKLEMTDEEKFLQERKECNIDLLLHGILVK